MVNSYRRENLFERKRFSPGTLATANTPDKITNAQLNKLKENETMKLNNVNPPLHQPKILKQQKTLEERVKERVRNLYSLLYPIKNKKEMVVKGYSPPSPPKGGYNSQKYKHTNMTKQPKKPKILTKQPKKPNNNK